MDFQKSNICLHFEILSNKGNGKLFLCMCVVEAFVFYFSKYGRNRKSLICAGDAGENVDTGVIESNLELEKKKKTKFAAAGGGLCQITKHPSLILKTSLSHLLPSSHNCQLLHSLAEMHGGFLSESEKG